jgi:uroporphyrinogen decarboxylase
MNSRERVLKTFKFEQTDRVPYDIMEGNVWHELMQYFRQEHGIKDEDAVRDFLGTDFRWTGMDFIGPHSPAVPGPTAEDRSHSLDIRKGPLSGARTVADVLKYKWEDPAWHQPQDFAAVRKRFQNHALVFCPGWSPLFWSACTAFGMEEALTNMISAPKLFEAFVKGQHEFYMDILLRGLKAAEGYCDICWLGDDYASQKDLIMSPELWRKFIKPYLSEHVRAAREHGMYVMIHSCGAIRSILKDFIDIGINAHLVFQTSAKGMDAKSIARDFGGKLVFYGGIDVQHTLSDGTIADVEKEVRSNVKTFAKCGGYIVSNCHHTILTVKGKNMVAMFNAARKCTFPFKD